MIRLTPEWTKSHTYVLMTLGLAVLGTAVAAWGNEWWVALAIAVLFILTAAVGMSFDVFLASGVGVLAAAGAIAVKQFAGSWGTDQFTGTVIEVAFFFLTGWAAGMAGAPLRSAGKSKLGAKRDELVTYSGSLGLLDAAAGETRLEEEVERAELHRRPLSLLRIRTEIREPDKVSESERVSIYRMVARLVEGMLRPTDIPFAYEDNSMVAILPEMEYEDSWELVAPLVDALRNATFVVRPEGHRHHAGDYADVQIGVVSYPDHGLTAFGLLDASLHALPEKSTVSGSEPQKEDPDQE